MQIVWELERPMPSEIYSLAMGMLHDARFLRDNRAAERAGRTWARLLESYQAHHKN